MSTEYKVLETEINNIKDDIKEIKNDTKETNKYFRETIDTLKENSLLQTQILKNQELQSQQQFAELNKDVQSLNGDISGLRKDFNANVNNQTKWYQDFLSDTVGKVLKILFIIILILLGLKLANIDIIKLLGIL